ncbi:hypothetical protein A2422_00400 [Candidatus Woesebacteria bacterium RIFOXYC1_FULL_31_51]|uniref:Uncharacterized protein n=1 Tax=Candidatus Woesebacteria bacterium GW2011_GWC2_31_9 TaxID=1618586 RepID=A0A0G0AYK4_9BACT|nr:MAG: hypothetical protein UR17_C0001G0401 [Candidatus Woesebacteria bacterium GW2011_GWF1_31_35]KKP23110.1 MAG: hypothetical protein UR11_C0001G0084 [Candidatus Woesebacteria bacterium GW2011_GWC1_30_29]KKP26798.1 MAG: hypothetical protein UR13_C0002G0033 [Candidatus Woesebacteria bacterium GW2011_GWD1_31_12]KKP27373.1 MAG: hypothetical protein UR16_C0003G0033 [Candidatus Woesebacteria bacterium GW2011_GWB1_31_29]KKP31600.1 MAG: hypothetical protein UR21_C0007G0017 [Candidatus Woesebacteria 
MKKDCISHLIFLLLYFILITLVKKYFSFSFWPFWVGGLVGLFLSNVDHLLHVFVFKPYELTSQRVIALMKAKRFKEALILLYDTKNERTNLIFHSLNFQIIFLILTFWLLSSSGNLFGRGLVLSFLLNLVIFLLRKIKTNEIILIDNNKSKLYFIGVFLTLFIFGFLF